MKIGEKIFELRKNKKLSQEDLAEVLGVSRQTISNWELGETSPDLKQAKELSKVFKISLDELVNNDIKDILVEKVSNTEKLAGITIKILKVMGVLFSIFVVFFIGIFMLFNFARKESPSSGIKSTTIDCTIKNDNYKITIGDSNYFKCDNCNKKMKVYLEDITDWANRNQSIKNIKTYFSENGGTCKVE